MWHLNEICVGGATRFARCEVTLTAWKIRCARDKSLSRIGGVRNRKRDCRLSGWALNNVTKRDGRRICGVEAEGNRWGG